VYNYTHETNNHKNNTKGLADDSFDCCSHREKTIRGIGEVAFSRVEENTGKEIMMTFPDERICQIPDCGKKHFSKGLCAMHWARVKKYGDPNVRNKGGPKGKGVRIVSMQSNGEVVFDRIETNIGSIPLIGIYKITSPSGRVYIGQSWNIKKRWNKYRSDVPDLPQPILQASFLKYGAKNHSYEVLKILSGKCTQDELDWFEKVYIEYYKNLGVKMMNCRDGGSVGKHSKETREKISRTQKGKRVSNSGSFKKGHVMVFTQEHREKISQAKRGIKLSEETKRKLSEINSGEKHPKFGTHHSEETRRKIGDAQRGRKFSGERVEKMRLSLIGKRPSGEKHHFSKKVLDIFTGQIFCSITEAAEFYEADYPMLNSKLSGRTKNDTRLVLL